jgi:hypothetical protein
MFVGDTNLQADTAMYVNMKQLLLMRDQYTTKRTYEPPGNRNSEQSMLLEKLNAVMKEMSRRVTFIVSLSKATVMKSASSCKQQLSRDVPVDAGFLCDKAAIHGVR